MDNYNIIADLEQYTNYNSILIISKDGKLIRLFIPVVTMCIIPIADWKPGDFGEITAFKISSDLRLVYTIQDKGFYHSYFEIIHG